MLRRHVSRDLNKVREKGLLHIQRDDIEPEGTACAEAPRRWENVCCLGKMARGASDRDGVGVGDYGRPGCMRSS